MITNSNYTYTYGATINVPAKPFSRVFILSQVSLFNTKKEAWDFAEMVKKEYNLDCSPTARRTNQSGYFEAVIYNMVVVTIDGLPDDSKIEFWHIPAMYISLEHYNSMNAIQKLELLKQTNSVAYRGLVDGI